MLADDSPQFLHQLRAVLGEFGIPVVAEATDGLGALELAMQVCPDIVVMDLRMGALGGIEAAGMIKQQLPRTQIVILSADDRDPRADPAGDAVVFRHLPKGCRADVILDTLLDAWTASMAVPTEGASAGDDDASSLPGGPLQDELALDPPPVDVHGPAPRVLVVDDEPNVLSALCELLEDQGCAVVGRASDGRQAVELAAETRPDVVLMDMRMPVLDGIEATRLIREQDPFVQVVMLSAYEDAGLRQGAQDVGVYCYLVKGCSATLIGDMVRAAAQHRGTPVA
jgi:DNA-binding NarL/FixJ family response regulator